MPNLLDSLRQLLNPEMTGFAVRPAEHEALQGQRRWGDIELPDDPLGQYMKDLNFPAEPRLVPPPGNSYKGEVFTPGQELQRFGLSREGDIDLPLPKRQK